MSKLWLDGSGKLLVDGSGHPYDCEECPCDDACDGPSEVTLESMSVTERRWTPTSTPPGGGCDGSDGVESFVYIWRLKSPASLTQDGPDCEYYGEADFEESYDGVSFSDDTSNPYQIATVHGGTQREIWFITTATQFPAVKLTDLSDPTGNYDFDTGCEDEVFGDPPPTPNPRRIIYEAVIS
jgi:hypothetical protein